jgi:hypothetical protein
MSKRADRLPLLDGLMERSIQNGGGNLLLELVGHVSNGFKKPVEMKSRFR